MASELLVATRSLDKLEEIRAIAGAATKMQLVLLSELNVQAAPAEDDLETYETFVENAVAKARYFALLTGRRTIADDSGLMVDALGGAPGVRTKRFALDHGISGLKGSALDTANVRLLLEEMAHHEDRRARYVSAVALADGDRVMAAVGTCAGEIFREPRGSGGFGYDPIFYIPALDATFAELTPEEKNKRSHRALAMRAMTPHLKEACAVDREIRFG